MATQTPPKTMSSRLLTMKFMQRAAASSTASSPSTPQSEEKSSKRRKLSHSPSAQQSIDALVDQTAVRKALADEERKRQEAVVRNAAESGDARWVLNTQKTGATRSSPVQTPLNVVQVGFAQIDSSDNTDGQVGSLGTDHGAIQPFRRYNMDKKKVCFFPYAAYSGASRNESNLPDYRRETTDSRTMMIPTQIQTQHLVLTPHK